VALDGVEQWAHAWAGLHPERKVGAVLITNAEPNECDTDTTHLADLAAQALASSTRTFVVSFNSTAMAPQAIADAGGTGNATQVDSAQALVSALGTISHALGDCHLLVGGDTADGGLLNLVQGNVPLSRVASAAACPAQGGAWFYDGADVVVLCPTACGIIDAGVQALVGCPSH
jgi:hypothetical protein